MVSSCWLPDMYVYLDDIVPLCSVCVHVCVYCVRYHLHSAVVYPPLEGPDGMVSWYHDFELQCVCVVCIV